MKRFSSMSLRDLIFEQEDVDLPVSMDNATKATRLSKKSVDDQIDAYILKFENASIGKKDSDVIAESLRMLSLLPILKEQEEEEAEEDMEEDFGEEEGDSPGEAAEDPEVSDPAGSEDVEVEDAVSIVKKPPIDIDNFAKDIARLSMNYNAQLDIPTVIVNRAISFLKENYDDVHAKSLIETLNSEFDFNIGLKSSSNQRPAALGAFGEPEGLSGTGGGIPAEAGGTD